MAKKTKNYRMDWRTKEEFKKDIKDRTRIEQVLMEKYVNFLRETYPEAGYVYENKGVDNTGEFIEDEDSVTANPDFYLKNSQGIGYNVEIKSCQTSQKCFHLKTSQIKKYIKTNTVVVTFMNVGDEEKLMFCILTPNELEIAMMTKNKFIFKPWNKECIKFECKDHEWTYLT